MVAARIRGDLADSEDSLAAAFVLLVFVSSVFEFKYFTQRPCFCTKRHFSSFSLERHFLNLHFPIVPVEKRFDTTGYFASSATSPIVFARLATTYAVPGCSFSQSKLLVSVTMCLVWSPFPKPASKPWNLLTETARARTSGQYLALQHFFGQLALVTGVGTCFAVEDETGKYVAQAVCPA